jgi:hypothetical protein
VLPLQQSDTCFVACNSSYDSFGSLEVGCTPSTVIAFTSAFPAGCASKPGSPDTTSTPVGVEISVTIITTNNTNLTALIEQVVNQSGVPASQINVTTQTINGTVVLVFTTTNTTSNFTDNVLVTFHTFDNGGNSSGGNITIVNVKVKYLTLLALISRQPTWLVLLILAFVFLCIVLFYFYNRHLNPEAKNFIVITTLCSVGHVITVCLFLRWLHRLLPVFPSVEKYFWISLVSLSATILLNMFTNTRLLLSAMNETAFADHVKDRQFATGLIFVLAATNCALMTLLNSGLFGMWSLSAPVSESLGRLFSVAGVVSNLAKDLPQLVIQALVMSELHALNVESNIVAITFTAASLVFALGKRTYLFIRRSRLAKDTSMVPMELQECH